MQNLVLLLSLFCSAHTLASERWIEPKLMATRYYYGGCAVSPRGLLSCWRVNQFDASKAWKTERQIRVSAAEQLLQHSEFEAAILENGSIRVWDTDSGMEIKRYKGMKTLQKVAFAEDRRIGCSTSQRGLECWSLDERNVPFFITPPPVGSPSLTSRPDCVIGDQGSKLTCWKYLDGIRRVWEHSFPDLLTNATIADDLVCGMNRWGAAVCKKWINFSDSPVPSDLGRVTQIETSTDHVCALRDNDIKCWLDSPTQLDYPKAASLVQVPSLVSPSHLTVAKLHSCALDIHGVHCWGPNFDNLAPIDPMPTDWLGDTVGWNMFFLRGRLQLAVDAAYGSKLKVLDEAYQRVKTAISESDNPWHELGFIFNVTTGLVGSVTSDVFQKQIARGWARQVAELNSGLKVKSLREIPRSRRVVLSCLHLLIATFEAISAEMTDATVIQYLQERVIARGNQLVAAAAPDDAIRRWAIELSRDSKVAALMKQADLSPSLSALGLNLMGYLK